VNETDDLIKSDRSLKNDEIDDFVKMINFLSFDLFHKNVKMTKVVKSRIFRNPSEGKNFENLP